MSTLRPSDSHRTLRAALRELDARGEDHIRAQRASAARNASMVRAVPLFVLGAFTFVVLRWLGVWPEPRYGALSWSLLAALVMGPYLVWVAWQALVALSRRVPEGAGLGVLDRQLALKDRLRTAASFLPRAEAGAASAFQQAAIEDAAAHLDEARRAALTHAHSRVRSAPRYVWAAGLAALALVLVGFWVRPWTRGTDQVPAMAERDADEATQVPTVPPRKAMAKAEREASEPDSLAPVQVRTPSRPEVAAGGQDRSGRMGDEVKRSTGRTQAGRAAEAGAPTDATQAQSAPSEQGQAAEGGSRKPRPPTSEKPERSPRPEAKRPDAVERSGATTGSGSSRGASRNPSSNAWSSRDQVPDAGSEAPSEEDDVEDEDESSEARGGMQPTLRSRKPPVNRDLGVGFGNRANLDANGRGGPSQRKKSRGTASLILGVPVPDHIKGMPNPGRTKVTQERVEPQAEPSTPLDAGARAPRTDPIGHVPRFDLAPWMHDIVKRYFLSRPGGRPSTAKEGS